MFRNLLNLRNLIPLATTLFAAFIIISLMSSVYFMGMNPDGTMSHCVFMGGVCTMTLSDHLISWQGIFTATLQKTFSLDFLLLIVSIAFILTAITFRSSRGQISSRGLTSQIYYKQKQYVSFFNYLKEAFSQGILNPKIYSVAF